MTGLGEPDGVNERVSELKKVSDQAAGFAAGRAGVLASAMDDVLPRRSVQAPPPGGGPSFGVLQVKMAPTLEEIAVERIRATVILTPPLVIREYAVPRPSPPTLSYSGTPTSPDTILWQPIIVLPADGKATIPFTLGNAPGGYQIVVAGHTADGRLGAYRGVIPVVPSKTVVPAKTGEQATPAGSVPPGTPLAPTAPPPPPAPPKP